jgi:hypothetical protein
MSDLLDRERHEILILEICNSAQLTHQKKRGNQIVIEASHVALRGCFNQKLGKR